MRFLLVALIFCLGCAVKKPAAPVVQPFIFDSQPEIVMLKLPANCIQEYTVEAPHTRENVSVVFCHTTKEEH